MKSRLLVIFISIFILTGTALAQDAVLAQGIVKTTETFAVEDGIELKMDIYKSDSVSILPQPCLVFVFGGGFKDGSRDAKGYYQYFNYFAGKGFTVVSIDYRLGMKDQKAPGVLSFKPLQNAISLAVEDLYTATGYLIENAERLYIDPSLIIISGSSAGAITVLHADYEKRNSFESAKMLPDDFRYAGVISFAGGIFSKEGTPSYTVNPAPTLFFHGSADRLVPYNKTRLFNLGMFGSKPLSDKFRQEKYPFIFYNMEGVGHEVSEYPMREFLPEIERFINDLVLDRKQLMIDVNYNDMLRKSSKSVTPGDYYN